MIDLRKWLWRQRYNLVGLRYGCGWGIANDIPHADLDYGERPVDVFFDGWSE